MHYGNLYVRIEGAAKNHQRASSTVFPAEAAERVIKRMDEGWSLGDAVADAIEGFEGGPWPIRYGDRSLKVVLTFAHGQTVEFPLKLKDTTGIAGVELKDVFVENVKVLVRAQDEAERKCRLAGHELKNLKTVGSKNRYKTHGVCTECGEKIRFFRDDDRTDVDAMIARDVVATVFGGTGKLEDDLAHLDILRRRLESRAAELQEALDELAGARAILGARIEKVLQP